MCQGAADPAADAAQEDQVRGPGECLGRAGRPVRLAREGQGLGASAGWPMFGLMVNDATMGSRSFPRRATSYARCCYRTTSRTGSPARGGTFQTPWALVSIISLPPLWLSVAHVPRPWAHPSVRLPPLPPAPFNVGSPTPGLDQDWSAIAATQCRLDKEGATKLVCDLITSTKNEKIFQESIGLAIRLLDGGNTEIQVWRGWGC